MHAAAASPGRVQGTYSQGLKALREGSFTTFLKAAVSLSPRTETVGRYSRILQRPAIQPAFSFRRRWGSRVGFGKSEAADPGERPSGSRQSQEGLTAALSHCSPRLQSD